MSDGVIYWAMFAMFVAGALLGYLLRELGVGK